MAVYSMTGYASVQIDAGESAAPDGLARSESAARLGVEIRSVNSRFLDLSFRLADELRACEPALRELLTRRLRHGKVELRAGVEAASSADVAEPSVRLLQRLSGVQDRVRAWLPDARALSVADVLRLGGSDHPHDVDWQAALLPAAARALDALLQARATEGERLALLLRERTAQLRALAAQAEPLVPQLVAQQRQRFLERWREALALGTGAALPDAAQDRALAEATAFALRIDVAEELGRLRAHLDEIEALLERGGELGKRLDFLIQELHREANTLGSKSAMLELTRISVEMKVLIEQMREQVQNIE
ncbi:YicC/YloC family endoribonuclease [Tibeticola sp.]|uniref:YicC/YloC family endoribonuclease n=1 Tax=Tibeticola sp. TaxID=2005368 RepID=UPI0025E55CB2|nr:YicC/YloC family endoribonuclease [Tibeticola sp.]